MSTNVTVLLLAFEAALYPTLIAAVVILLAQPGPKRMLGAYLVGGLVMSILAGCLIVFALGGAVNSSSDTVAWGADLAVGGLLLLLAVALARRDDVKWRERRAAKKGTPPPAPEEADKEPWSTRILAKGSVPLVFLAGFAINVPGAAYLIGLKDIAAAQYSTAHSVTLILAFNVIMFAFAEIPLAGLIFAPEKTKALVARFNAWLTSHSRQVAIVVCLVIAVYLIVKGLSNA